ncbi:MAG: recombinase family protein, partial [Planctomycetota bacterium]
KIIGYLRISTSKQDLENQKYVVLKLANTKGWRKVDFVEEQVSGRVSYKKRLLGNLLNDLQKSDVLIVSELSRLGRSVLEILEILKVSSEKGIKIFGVKENREINGNSIESKILSTMLAMVSEIERDLISRRTKEALARKKAQGFKLGRPKGVPGKSKLDGKEEEIKKFLNKGLNVTALAKIYDVSWTAMKNFLNKKVYAYED